MRTIMAKGNVMPTLKDVLDAFEALGGTANQAGALQGHLENQGFDYDAVVTAINSALTDGHLTMDSRTGAIRKS